MTLFDWIVLAVALVVTYFGGISIFLTLMVGVAVIIVYRLINKGSPTP